MVDAVNTVGVAAPAATGQQTGRWSATQAGGTVAKSPSGGATTTAASSALIYFDPAAGGTLVTEQINAQGNVVQQTPSAVVLAYLRDGLTSEGLPKQSVSTSA